MRCDPAETLVDDHFPAIPGRLPAILDAIPDPLWLFDERDRLVGWNRAAERVFGLPTEHAVGQSVLLFVPHEGLIEFARAAEAVRRDGAWAGDLTTQTATGDVRLVEARWSRLVDEEGSSLVVAVQTDVTARRKRDADASRAERWGLARSLTTAIAEELARDADSTVDFLRRFANASDPTASVLHRGAGDWVLVTGPRPLARELIRAVLDAAGYHPVVATDRYHAARLAARFRDSLRAVVLAFEPDVIGVAADLRRFHPILPMVVVDELPTTSADTMLQAVAEAVAETRLTDAMLLTG